MAKLLGTALLVLSVSASGCRQGGSPGKRLGARQDPLSDPAGFCARICQARVACRLGTPTNEEQQRIVAEETKRCLSGCYRWMADQPLAALEQGRCLAHRDCQKLRACLAEVRRLAQAVRDPAKERECLGLCVDVGQCGGPERRCMERCRSRDLAVYRALERCENRGCPYVAQCYRKHVGTTPAPW